MQSILTHGSLFSGIGGFDLAAQWTGWQNVFHCEWNPFGQRVLKHYWPNAESFYDITKSNFTHYAGRIDVLTGGFPCQPYSTAGKRLGKEDERHLWPEMLRAIREVQPRWVVGENVSGLINWSGGLVFNEVQADLEAEGYEVRAFVLPAAGVNAPHRRDRIWFVAYSDNLRISKQGESAQQQGRTEIRATGAEFINGAGSDDVFGFIAYAARKSGERMQSKQRSTGDAQKGQFRGGCCGVGDGHNANTSNTRLQGCKDNRSIRGSGQESHKQPAGLLCPNWDNFPTQSPVCGRNDGVPGGLDGITFSKWRNESVKAYGNAIVPQVAYQIFKAIEAASAQMQNVVSLH
jgi:DNA (cytosine-5)-methyltransferase 1